MANVYGTQQTKANSVPMKMGDAHSMGGRMRVLSDSYLIPAASAVTVGDVLTIGELPRGARVWEAHMGVSATTGTAKLELGTIVTSGGVTTTDSDALLGPVVHSSNFNRSIESGQNATTASVVPLSYPDGATIIVTNSVAKWTSGETITVTIKYTID
tara:strand:+ start:743 stop:1213 length:471 start_codon:yes stop_codon:yes gene_type:complete